MSKKKTQIVHPAWFDYNVELDKRIIFFGGVDTMSNQDDPGAVDHYSVQLFIKGLLALDLAAPEGDQPIKVIMNSPGGAVYEGLAAFDAIKGCKNEVHVLVLGHAMSMGAWILQAADRRLMAPHATMMIHAGTDGYYGHPTDLKRRAKESARLDKLNADLYLKRIREKHPKYTRAQVEKLLVFDTFLTAKEAVELGLADEVIGE